MVVTHRIQEYVQKLPEPFQAEVLDFVEYLLWKAERGEESDEEIWSDLSLAAAMRGMENEEAPEYTENDLKEVFA